MRVVVVGGGIAGLAAARRLEALFEEIEVVLVESTHRLGGKLLTEHVDGFVIEGAADSFLSRKERGIGLCEELGLGAELIARRPENARSFVRRGDELHPLPEGLTGMIPTSLEALSESRLLSDGGRERFAAEENLPAAPPDGDESIASFVARRFGREAYERLVEPLMAGIYAGDGEQLSLRATFPNLRALELEHGSVLRGLAAQSRSEPPYPAFVGLRSGMQTLADTLVESLEHTTIRGGTPKTLRTRAGRYALDVGDVLLADGVVIATPAPAASTLVSGLDSELAELIGGIPYASSAVVTLGYRREDVRHPLDGYGYVVPATEGSEVLACTWTSSKWEERAPAGHALLRVYLRGISPGSDQQLVDTARAELSLLEVTSEPCLTRLHRWPVGMPQYVLGHPERLERIDTALARHPGVALAGAAYRGVGIPDCIASGEAAADSIVRSLSPVAG